MRIAVVSDIHANMDAFAAVLADVEKEGADRIVSLGDNVGYGPEPEAVMQALRRHRVVSVLGNHERALVQRGHSLGFNPQARKALEINRAMLSSESLAQMGAFPRFLTLAGARFVHGLPPDRTDAYVHHQESDRLARIMDRMAEPVCFVGHTHRLALYQRQAGELLVKKIQGPRVFLAKADRYIINSGSVGQPRDGLAQAVYLVWDTDTQALEVRFLTYDADRTIRLIRARGIPEVFADLLAQGRSGA